jgi:hypothetical protein
VKHAPARQQPKKTKQEHQFWGTGSEEKKEGRTPQHNRRSNALRERVERERGDDRACFAAGGRHAVRKRTELGREHFRRVDVRRTAPRVSIRLPSRRATSEYSRVSAEVEEELQECEEDDEACRAKRVEFAREDAEEKGLEQEAKELDLLPADLLDEENGEIVPRHEAERSHNQVAGRDFEELVPRRTGLPCETNLLQDDVLVEVDTVEPAVGPKMSISVVRRLLRMRTQRRARTSTRMSR